MAKKGRPFVYQRDEERPVTISLRVPHDLYERLQHYAQRHRQSVTELVKDGIAMRLEVQADPRWQTAVEQISYNDNTVLQELATPAHFLDDAIPFDDEHLPVRAPEATAVADISHDSNAVIQERVPKRRRRSPTLRPDRIMAVLRAPFAGLTEEHRPVPVLEPPAGGENNEQTAKSTPAYDPSKFYLGGLCPKGHAYEGTGQSLRRLGKHDCVVCDRERIRQYQARKRTHKAQQVETVMARIRQMHEAGMSSRHIAAKLQEEDVPTLRGTGTWHSGTVRKLVQRLDKAAHPAGEETVC